MFLYGITVIGYGIYGIYMDIWYGIMMIILWMIWDDMGWWWIQQDMSTVSCPAGGVIAGCPWWSAAAPPSNSLQPNAWPQTMDSWWFLYKSPIQHEDPRNFTILGALFKSWQGSNHKDQQPDPTVACFSAPAVSAARHLQRGLPGQCKAMPAGDASRYGDHFLVYKRNDTNIA